MVALGELVKVCAEKEIDLDLNTLKEEIKTKKIEVYRPGHNELTRFSSLMNLIRQQAWGLEPTDMMILAYGLIDDACEGILTFELKFIQNPGIAAIRKSEECNKPNFVVTDDTGL
jgi:hypothetical protein